MLPIPFPLRIPSTFSFPASYCPLFNHFIESQTPEFTWYSHFSTSILSWSQGQGQKICRISISQCWCILLWMWQVPLPPVTSLQIILLKQCNYWELRCGAIAPITPQGKGALKCATDKNKVLIHRKCPYFTGVWCSYWKEWIAYKMNQPGLIASLS